MGDAHWDKRPEKEGQLEELVNDQSPNPEAPARSKIRRERSEQRRYQGRSDCQTSNGEEQVCQGHCGGVCQKKFPN